MTKHKRTDSLLPSEWIHHNSDRQSDIIQILRLQKRVFRGLESDNLDMFCSYEAETSPTAASASYPPSEYAGGSSSRMSFVRSKLVAGRRCGNPLAFGAFFRDVRRLAVERTRQLGLFEVRNLAPRLQPQPTKGRSGTTRPTGYRQGG